MHWGRFLALYRGLPIEVKEIMLVDGKKIAIVNLSEAQDFKESSPENYKGFTWCMMYFQGSCGGITTSKNLMESFLQRDFKGVWIDGVQFLYEGGRVEFEHVGVLYETQYR